MGLKKTKANDHAKTLFLSKKENLTVKEIAERVGVRPSTVSNWIKRGNWKKLRQSLMVTRQQQISDMYDQLEILNNHIKTRPVIYDTPDKLPKGKCKEDYPIKVGNFPNSKEANTQISITNNIKKLETETSIAEIYEVATSFCDFVKPQDFDLYKTLVPLFDTFIQEKIS